MKIFIELEHGYETSQNCKLEIVEFYFFDFSLTLIRNKREVRPNAYKRRFSLFG